MPTMTPKAQAEMRAKMAQMQKKKGQGKMPPEGMASGAGRRGGFKPPMGGGHMMRGM